MLFRTMIWIKPGIFSKGLVFRQLKRIARAGPVICRCFRPSLCIRGIDFCPLVRVAKDYSLSKDSSDFLARNGTTTGQTPFWGTEIDLT